MSADNTVVIGRFKDGYRVTHMQAAEDCDKQLGVPEEVTNATRLLRFRKSDVYHDLSAAWYRAKEIYDSVCFVEYGVQICEYDEPFPDMTVKQAEKILADYWKSIEQERGAFCNEQKTDLFAQEQATYEREKADLLISHEGKWALIQGDSIHPLKWDTYADAIQFGYHVYGPNMPFMIKQILRVDPVEHI
jgi:hypothetical protein